MVDEKNGVNVLYDKFKPIVHEFQFKRNEALSKFNIFKALKIETKEELTHSNFIAELLNPKGSHHLGDIFLKKFLQVVPPISSDHLDLKSVVVQTELAIGGVDLNEGEGGRIDIYLNDKRGYSISVENKIYALDQELQVERYCNFNSAKNKVLYLTLDGKLPSESSRGNKLVNKDYFCISYKNEVLQWLEECLDIGFSNDFLKTNITQYKLLIENLTNHMSDQNTSQVKDLIIDNYETAEFIANNFQYIVNKMKEDFRLNVATRLKGYSELLDFEIEIGQKIESKNGFAQLWIKPKKEQSLCYGVETFSGFGHHDGDMFVGVFDSNGAANRNRYWLKEEFIIEPSGQRLNLSSRASLVTLKDSENELLEVVVEQVLEFISNNSLQEEIAKSTI